MTYIEPLGDEVGPGWMPIVSEVHEKLCHLDPDYRVGQIKEKFGGLRYYFDSSFAWDTIEYRIMCDVVRAAEAKCASVCEFCGKRGDLRRMRGWYKTVCDEHDETVPRPTHDLMCPAAVGRYDVECACDVIAAVRAEERALVAVEQTTLAELNAEYRKGLDAAREAVERVSTLFEPLGPALAAIDALRHEA